MQYRKANAAMSIVTHTIPESKKTHFETSNAGKAAAFITNKWRTQPGKYFCLCATDPGVTPNRGVFFGRDEFDQVISYITENIDKNIWWCPHGFGRRRRLKKWAVNPRWLYADLDGVDPDNLIVPPTELYESSPERYVGLWHMDKPVGFEINKRVNYACAEDKSGWMTTKFLRVPYTINRKKGRKNATVRMVRRAGPRYTMATLKEALGLWDRISDKAMGLLRKKYKNGDNRSDHRASIVNQLVGEGFNDDQIYELFGNANPWVSDYKKLMRDIKRLRSSYNGRRQSAKPEFDPGKPKTARELQKKEIVPLEFIIDDYFPEGVNILAGRPKAGKSLMAQHIGLAVARGGKTLGVKCERGEVLYLMIEGGENHLRRRISLFLGEQRTWPKRFQYYTEFPRFDEGALKFIKRWLDEAKEPRLIIVDTLAAVKGRVRMETTTTDYDSIAPFTTLISQYPGVGAILVAHTRKSGAEDPIDEVSSTLGTTAAVDGVSVLRQKDGKIMFYGRGRELEEFNKVVELDYPLWHVLGDEDKVVTADNPKKILEALKEDGKPLTPLWIEQLTGIAYDTVKTTLKRMLQKGVVKKVKRGEYAINR